MEICPHWPGAVCGQPTRCGQRVMHQGGQILLAYLQKKQAPTRDRAGAWVVFLALHLVDQAAKLFQMPRRFRPCCEIKLNPFNSVHDGCVVAFAE